MVNDIGLNTHNHLHPYHLGWVHKDASLKVTKQYKLKFVICAKFINEVVVDVVPLDICGFILANPYL